jgi:hypothetical protein
VEASSARVSQSGLKTGDGVAQVVHVASSRRSCGDQVKDEWVDAMSWVRPCYLYFVIFIVFYPRGILVFQSFTWDYK